MSGKGGQTQEIGTILVIIVPERKGSVVGEIRVRCGVSIAWPMDTMLQSAVSPRKIKSNVWRLT